MNFASSLVDLNLERYHFLSNHQCWCRTTTKNTTRRMAAAFSRLAVWNCGQMFSTIVKITPGYKWHMNLFDLFANALSQAYPSDDLFEFCVLLYSFCQLYRFAGVVGNFMSTLKKPNRNQRKGSKDPSALGKNPSALAKLQSQQCFVGFLTGGDFQSSVQCFPKVC